MKASPEVIDRRRAAVIALLAAQAEPGVGRFSVPQIAELLHIPEPTARSDSARAVGSVPACTHRLNRHGRRYPLDRRWQRPEAVNNTPTEDA